MVKPMPEVPWKVFVWEGVLKDYSAGMAVAIGRTLEDALASFEPRIEEELRNVDPIEIDLSTVEGAMSWYVWGGG
jgi:hypothetical protein